jgi:rSAM/selenodomain-associated transferase 2
MHLSIIIPVLNEADALAATLLAARAACADLGAAAVEIIVVDGGSSDSTGTVAARLADRVVVATRGRARQMNAGAAVAGGEVLLFLHADTLLPVGAGGAIMTALGIASCRVQTAVLSTPPPPPRAARWGRFDVRIAGAATMLAVVAWCMNQRSRATGIATGDQAIFVRRSVFDAIGGFADLVLMEDIDLSRRLKRHAAPCCLHLRVLTSGRRWESRGVWRTIFLMWWLRLRYWLGASPQDLLRAYR